VLGTCFVVVRRFDVSRASSSSAAAANRALARQVQRIDPSRSPELTLRSDFQFNYFQFFITFDMRTCDPAASPRLGLHGLYIESITTTLGGGSLGSCVDEERSQLRELM
jgi:hypothetical protein